MFIETITQSRLCIFSNNSLLSLHCLLAHHPTPLILNIIITILVAQEPIQTNICRPRRGLHGILYNMVRPARGNFERQRIGSTLKENEEGYWGGRQWQEVLRQEDCRH
ncbi:hypothetical protein PM082_024070 [Marasmius tenuissimus]|nr:hypothetical protein PM082_024070 [Marasmius tenuissimus]